MAIRILEKHRVIGGGEDMYRCIFSLDSKDDIADLPTNTEALHGLGPVAPDSAALVIGDGTGGSVYIMNSKGDWVKI